MDEAIKHDEIVITPDFIDVENVIASKNPMLARTMPRFVLSYLKRIVHEDTVNDTLYRNRDKWGLDFVNAILDEFRAKIVTVGIENIPEKERVLIAGNHPLGGLDGLALLSVVGALRKDVIFPVNDLLLNLPNVRELFIPVNKHGSNASNVRLFEEAFASDKVILYFPAGLCSRKQKGRITDLDWKKSFVTKSRKHERAIIPTFVSGQNSSWFYNLSNFRSSLGIKANLEMLYLADEMYKQRDQEIRITFGKPIPYDVFDRSHPDKFWAEKIKEHVYKLDKDPDAVFEID